MTVYLVIDNESKKEVEVNLPGVYDRNQILEKASEKIESDIDTNIIHQIFIKEL